jgi:hypothetical protein
MYDRLFGDRDPVAEPGTETGTRGRVPDRLLDALDERLGDQAMLELTYVTARYLQHAVMARAAHGVGRRGRAGRRGRRSRRPDVGLRISLPSDDA